MSETYRHAHCTAKKIGVTSEVDDAGETPRRSRRVGFQRLPGGPASRALLRANAVVGAAIWAWIAVAGSLPAVDRLFLAAPLILVPGCLALGVVAGLVGVGIAASPTVEVIAVLVLALAVAALGVVVIAGLVPALGRWRVRAPLAVAWAAVTLSMGYALAHGVATYPGGPSDPA